MKNEPKQDNSVEQVRLAAREFGDRVFTYPNVIGYGVGKKKTRGQKTGATCLVVFVARKLPMSQLRAPDCLPSNVDTTYGPLPIDVVEQAEPRLLVDSKTYRPLRGGCQITANATGGLGTLGAIMYDRTDAETVLLTCNHVLTAAGQRTALPANTVVSQPTFGNPVGRTKRIVPWFRTPLGDYDAMWQARVDAGIVAVDPGIDAQFRVIDLGKHPYVPLPPYEGLEVQKRGFTTELTTGTVEHIDVTIIIRDPVNEDRVRIGGPGSGFSIRSQKDKKFAIPGDSGSLIVDADGGAARGILFGGEVTDDRQAIAGGLTYACQLSAVMEELDIETPCIGSMDAMFMRALRRRFMISTLKDVDLTVSTSLAGNFRKFRARYVRKAPKDSVGGALEDLFQSMAAEFSEGLALDDDFAGLIDVALGNWLVQPSVFDMLEYKLPTEIGDNLMRAFERLKEFNPHLTGFEWIRYAFENSDGIRMREVLSRSVPKLSMLTKEA